jgi:hypothetical protein
LQENAMKPAAKLMSLRFLRIATVLCFAQMALAALASHASLSSQSVALRADRFTYEQWTSGDLQTLAATLRATQPSSVELYACGPDANPALLAAAQRLSDLPLLLQVMPAGDMHCGDVATAPASGPNRAAYDDAAVARYWQQVMP